MRSDLERRPQRPARSPRRRPHHGDGRQAKLIRLFIRERDERRLARLERGTEVVL